MDELKKYLHNHAEELNLDEPRAQVWQNIQRETQVVKKTSVVVMVTRWAVAACVLGLAGIGLWSVLRNDDMPQQTAQTAAVQKQPVVTAPVTSQPQAAQVEEKEPVLIAKTKTAAPRHRPAIQELPEQQNSREALAALHNIESSFTQVINLQRDRVSSTPMFAESPEYFNDFKVQIRQMEKDEKVIKSDIAKRGMNDEVLDQLINLYQQKLNTLKQLQIEMNKTNNRYKQNRTPVDSVKTYFLNL